MKHTFKTALATSVVAFALALSGCGSAANGAGDPDNVNPTGEIKPREISWLLSRPADGGVITAMKQLSKDYAKSHPGFSLNFITTPDRPSYIQKLETLAAANKLPELFDIDATPFAQKLAKKGSMMNAEKVMKSIGIYDSYRESALDYQRFDDGSLYMVPFETQAEFFWYNKALFKDAGVSIPETLDDIPQMCEQLNAKGITPIALDGQDQWPLERYMAYYPFRMQGTDFITNLKKGKAKFSDATGKAAVEWMAKLGSAGCFAKGFSSTGYADAQAMFTSGKAAIYNTGTWELSNLATDKLDSTVRNNVDYFHLPTIKGSKTDANEYVVSSGIGMAISSKSYDPLVKDFLKFALKKYPALLAKTGAISPTTDVETTIPDNATSLYKRSIDDTNKVGKKIAMPWDTQLDATSNTRLQQELTLLVQGNVSAKEFISTMDSTIAENGPKAFR